MVSSTGSSSLGSPNVQLLVNNIVSTSADFGTLTGNQSKQIIVVAKNNGDAASESSVSQLLGNADFSIAYNQCNNKVLTPKASCQIRVVFSAVGKNGSYVDTLSYAGQSLTLSAVAQPIVSFEPTYSSYGACSASLACQGSGVQSRSIETCNRLENGIVAESVDISNCSQFATPQLLERSCLSSAGTASQSVTGGVETRSCLKGQTFAQGSFVSISCDNGFAQQANQCVANQVEASLDKLSMGYNSTCFLTSENKVLCVGVNSGSHLGFSPLQDDDPYILTASNRYVQSSLGGDLANVKSLHATGFYGYNSCALTYDNEVFCWGSAASKLPIPPVKKISVDDNYGCGITLDDKIICWGSNNDLARGLDPNVTPVPYFNYVKYDNGSDVVGAVAISANSSMSCAVVGEKTLCWGLNSDNRFGSTRGFGYYFTPSFVRNSSNTADLEGIKDVKIGGNHTCVLMADKTMKCWGFNYGGRVGDGTMDDSSFPKNVLSPSGVGLLSDIKNISVNGFTSCATLENGNGYCWGFNAGRQIPTNQPQMEVVLPAQILINSSTPLLDISKVFLSPFSSCILTNNNSFYCGGYNAQGNLGTGDRLNKDYPMLVYP